VGKNTKVSVASTGAAIVGGSLKIKAGGSSSIGVAGDLRLVVAGNLRETISGKMQVTGPLVKPEGGGEASPDVELLELEAGKIELKADKLSLTVGGNLVLAMDKSGGFKLFGSQIEIEGDTAKLKSSKVEKETAGQGDKGKKGKQDSKDAKPRSAWVSIPKLWKGSPPGDGYIRFSVGTEKGKKIPLSQGKEENGQLFFEIKKPRPGLVYAAHLKLGKDKPEHTIVTGLLLDDVVEASRDAAVEHEHVTYHPPDEGEYNVTLDIDPKDQSSINDRFILAASDGSCRQELTVKDDTVKGDDKLQLCFTGLDKTKRYTFSWHDGEEEQILFEDLPYEHLDSAHEHVGELEHHEDGAEPGDEAEAVRASLPDIDV
jgi:hypothetical protein